MIKLENINAFWSDKVVQQYRVSSSIIRDYFDTHEEDIRKNIIPVFDELFEQGNKQQQLDETRRFSYLHIFYLQSSFYTKRYEVQLSLFNERSYMDSEECYKLWTPEFIMKYYTEDIRILERQAYDQVIHVGYPELMQMKKLYYPMYFLLVIECIKRQLAYITELPSFCELEKDDEFGIYFGGYMDKAVKLYPRKGE